MAAASPVLPLSASASEAGSSLNLLLIGSTGVGKSSLGNFLLDSAPSASDEDDSPYVAWPRPGADPREGDGQKFRTARTNNPETRTVKFESPSKKLQKWPRLIVIDTPGLNERPDEDLSHMIEIVKVVKLLESITACILCIKFESKIDTQYKTTIAYYAKLLPTLFEKNVVIVMTNFLCNDDAIMMREVRGIDVATIVTNTVHEVVESAKLRADPPVFLIDSVPLYKKDLPRSERDRQSILDYTQTLDPISIKDMTVAKTTELINYDKIKIGRLEGEVRGYITRLQQVNQAVASVLNEIEQKEKEVANIHAALQQIKCELRDKDSVVVVPSRSWNLRNSWKWFQEQSESFSISSSWPIARYDRWDNGHLNWVKFHVDKENGFAHGKVQGEWFRGLYANLTLLTEKRVMYKEEIARLNKEMESQEKSLKELTSALEKYKAKHSKHSEEVRLLNIFIKQQNERKEHLLAEYMTIDEACERLEEFKSRPI